MGEIIEKFKVKLRESNIYNRAIAKRDSGEFKVGTVAVALVVIVIVIVIAVSLLPTIFSSVATATSNTTLTSNAHYTSAFSLVYLIPLVFAAGILVLVLYLMFEKMD